MGRKHNKNKRRDKTGYGRFRRAPKEDRTAWGILFDSKKEMNRYKELRRMLIRKEISDLQRQPKFECVVNDQLICRYYADFQYVVRATGETVIEDVKGYKTDVYRLKKKLVEALFPIKIKET